MKSWPRPPVPVLPPLPELPRVFDTAAGGLVTVGPETGTARMYVCGITPYDATHLGHAFTYLTFDLLHRVWLDAGLDVNYVQNVTDVDDPLLERAIETGVDWEDLATEQIELFRSDMTALRVLPPDDYVGAVECINCVVALVERMRDTGLIYQVDDPVHPDWYFNSVAAPGFGGVSHLTRAEALRIFGERGGDPDRPGKRDALDCLVWQLAREGEPAWESSLGRGRPGWHIECTAIALLHLGPLFDVQGGGSDLAFPHHEMCAAQGIVAAHEPLAHAFVHSAMVGLDGEKMSKSLGNLVLVSELLAGGADPMAIRLALLAHHYREDWSWTEADLPAAEGRLRIWRDAVRTTSAMDPTATIERMRRALRDDLDVPTALAAVDTWASASSVIESDDVAAPQAITEAVDALLGIDLTLGER